MLSLMTTVTDVEPVTLDDWVPQYKIWKLETVIVHPPQPNVHPRARLIPGL